MKRREMQYASIDKSMIHTTKGNKDSLFPPAATPWQEYIRQNKYDARYEMAPGREDESYIRNEELVKEWQTIKH